MKYLYTLSFFLFSSLISFSSELEVLLNSGWKFKQVNKSEWYAAKVPGTVHTDLLDNGLIEDPYYRTNEKDLQWIEHEDWEYKSVFNVNSDLITKDKILLDFAGLDTYADVYINDSLILEANNMFRSWQVDVSELIQIGENELKVLFHSPIKRTAPVYDKLGYTYPVSSNDQSDKKLSIFSRKAPYHFGWDWGPRFVTCGIWRQVVLRAWDTAIMKEVRIDQKSLSDQSAELLVNVDFEVTSPFIGEIEVLIDGNPVKKSAIDLEHGHQNSNIWLSIQNPERWWPNGLGDQKLYQIEVLLKKDEEIIHRYDTKLGLRTIELIQKDDKEGSRFYFEVNGAPVFIKGANYIPQDNFLTRVTPQRYEHLLQSATDANMNMIRVWGGGIYENDNFYELCDEKGLLVWQDFMFSCAMYPGDDAFLQNVKTEAKENIKRLRTHPSIALWCGNNEILMKWHGWRDNANDEGNQTPLWSEPADSIKIVKAYQDIFEDILPSAVEYYGQGVPYWESSPSSKKGDYADWKSGDAHYWGVWWGQEPFEAYRDNIGRFMSEYGFQSFPELETVKTFTIEEDWDIYSEIMEAHQRSSIGNKTIANYMQRHFNEPKDFENYLYLSQLLQAEGVKVAMEAHRIAKPRNMGSLIWQLDDCWPVASWSSIDYFGRWKALHYYIKKAFNNVLVAFEHDDTEIRVHGISDDREEIKATLKLELIDLEGKIIHQEERKIKLKNEKSELIWKANKKDLLKKLKTDEVVLRAKLFDEEHLLSENILTFVPYKGLKLSEPAIKYDFKEKDGKLLIELKANKIACGVTFSNEELELRFSDNYFTLFPKETKTIEVISDEPIFEIKNRLTVKSLFDSFESK